MLPCQGGETAASLGSAHLQLLNGIVELAAHALVLASLALQSFHGFLKARDLGQKLVNPAIALLGELFGGLVSRSEREAHTQVPPGAHCGCSLVPPLSGSA
jgi:hypothetical protein